MDSYTVIVGSCPAPKRGRLSVKGSEANAGAAPTALVGRFCPIPALEFLGTEDDGPGGS
jgi:hypothetical protein